MLAASASIPGVFPAVPIEVQAGSHRFKELHVDGGVTTQSVFAGNYTVKAKVSEVILASSQCRTTVAETYQSAPAGTAPGIDGWGCGEGATSTKYVSGVATDANGVKTYFADCVKQA